MILETAPTARTTLTRRVLRASADPMRAKDCNDFPLAIERPSFRMRDGIRVGLNICFDLF